MKHVRRSKEPNVKQMLAMAANIREKFHKPSMIELKAWNFSSVLKTGYTVYVEHLHHISCDTWLETQDKYFELMKG